MTAISILCYNDSMCLEKRKIGLQKQITVLPCEALHSSFRVIQHIILADVESAPEGARHSY